MGYSKGNFNRKMYSDPKWQKAVSDGMTFKRIKVIKQCKKCLKSFEVVRTINRQNMVNIPKKEKRCCSRFCACSRILSAITKQKIAKALTKEQIFNEYKCLYCDINFKNIKNRKYCSKLCAIRSRRQGTNYTNYKLDCSFKFNVFNYPDEFDLKLLKTHGMYKAKNHGDNLNGVSRDHIISMSYGYKNSIDPKIISHPANCQLLIHRKNISKGTKIGITITELLNRIDLWNKKYLEYNNGVMVKSGS